MVAFHFLVLSRKGPPDSLGTNRAADVTVKVHIGFCMYVCVPHDIEERDVHFGIRNRPDI